jgi:hypothetical protein
MSTNNKLPLQRVAEELTLFIESHQLSAVSLLFLLNAESLIHKRSVILQTVLVKEMAVSGEDHRDAVAVGSLYYFVVADGAARLDDRAYSGFG